MIAKTYRCRRCGSAELVKNGHNASGSPQYHCKGCGAYGVLEPEASGYSEEEKERILRAYRERGSMRATRARLRGQPQYPLALAQKKGHQQPELSDTVDPAEEGDVLELDLELDEAWSFVKRKTNKRWLWTAMCRRTRQIVAFVIGDRSAKTCARLWSKIPEPYKSCRSFSDFWKAYGQVFSDGTHAQVDKKSGESSHVERFYCTLRQCLARYVRAWPGTSARRSRSRSRSGCITWSRRGSSSSTTGNDHVAFSHYQPLPAINLRGRTINATEYRYR